MPVNGEVLVVGIYSFICVVSCEQTSQIQQPLFESDFKFSTKPKCIINGSGIYLFKYLALKHIRHQGLQKKMFVREVHWACNGGDTLRLVSWNILVPKKIHSAVAVFQTSCKNWTQPPSELTLIWFHAFMMARWQTFFLQERVCENWTLWHQLIPE